MECVMRIINICVVVIAISISAMAVEYVYGWSKVKPLAEDAWNIAYQWSDGLVSGTTTADLVGALESPVGSETEDN